MTKEEAIERFWWVIAVRIVIFVFIKAPAVVTVGLWVLQHIYGVAK